MFEEVYVCSKKCRLCLCTEKFQIPIFGEDAQEMQICLKIRACLPIKVSQEDDFPKNICYKCAAALDQSYNLWKTSSESEAILKNHTSKENKVLSESNMQHQTFGRRSERKTVPLQAKNRRLLLSGMSLIVESDSEEEHGDVAPMSSLKSSPVAKMSTEWFWPDGDGHSEAVIMDTSPDFLESLSKTAPGIRRRRDQNETEMMDSAPNIPEPLVPNIRHPVPMKTKVQNEKSPPGSRWRSVSLFGTSANSWRDFYRSGEIFRRRELREAREGMLCPSSLVKEGTNQLDIPPYGQAAPTSEISKEKTVDSRSYEDVLQAMNECNYKAISQHSHTPSALLHFLHTQKDLDIPEQGPK